jgi:cyclopropane-fatty-acyl-phospholipid synthase
MMVKQVSSTAVHERLRDGATIDDGLQAQLDSPELYSEPYSMCTRFVFTLLRKLRHGRLVITDPNGSWIFGEPLSSDDDVTEDGSAKNVKQATVIIHDPRAYKEVILRGSIGAGEAYVRGDWSSPDLVAVVRVMAMNIDVVDAMESGLSRAYTKFLGWINALQRNNRGAAKRNIKAHYDLSNRFFSIFLDQSMMYSSAMYPNPSATLEQASSYKLTSICSKLELSSHHHLLEIGTGWGGLAVFAAENYGCRVTTTTISDAQYEYASERVREAGLQEQVTVLRSDYRDLDGRYDRLVSVEMIEAVGHQYINEFFAKCSRLLTEEGLMLVQAITIAEHRHKRAQSEVDFIQRYIFPGGALPSLGSMLDAIRCKTLLQPRHMESFGMDYARTLAEWRGRFMARLDDVRHL